MEDQASVGKSKDKIEAIYELREAVEQKVHAEVALDREGSSKARDALLEATLTLEAKTQDAIETCHDCGHKHAAQEPHGDRERLEIRTDNVIDVDFRSQAKRSEGNRG